MNARLIVKILHRAAAVPPQQAAPAPVDLHPINLMGDGLDAIFLRMRPDVCQPTPESRLLRYLRARHYCGAAADSRFDALRRSIGEAFQTAWSEGRRPNLRLCNPMRLRPVGLR